jgi:hypothetical protein
VVFYPLTARLAICGVYGSGHPRALQLDSTRVAEANTATIGSAQRFLWSRGQRLYYRMKKHNSWRLTLIAEELKARRNLLRELGSNV